MKIEEKSMNFNVRRECRKPRMAPQRLPEGGWGAPAGSRNHRWDTELTNFWSPGPPYKHLRCYENKTRGIDS